MKNYFVLLFLLAALGGASFGQKIHMTLNWTNPVEKNQESSEKMLVFTNATYPDDETLLPYFYYRTRVADVRAQYMVSLVNPVYIALNQQEKDILKNITLSNNIGISTNIDVQRKTPYLQISFVPIRKNPSSGMLEKLVSFDLAISNTGQLKNLKATKDYPAESVLKTGKWIKIKLQSDGIYKLTYTDLVEMGLTNPANVAIYGNANGMLPFGTNEDCLNDLVENPIWISKGTDNVFNNGDYILFYGRGPHTYKYDETNDRFKHIQHQYSHYSHYFVTDKGRTKTFETMPSLGTAGTTVSSFDDFLFHEEEMENLIKSGRNWVGEAFNMSNSQSFTFNFPNLVTSEPIKLITNTLARYSSATSWIVKANNVVVDTINHTAVNMSSQYATFASETVSVSEFNVASPNISITMQYNQPSSAAEAWLDYILINARRQLRLSGSQMDFRDKNTIGAGNISTFNLSGANADTRIWEITDPTNVKEVDATLNGTTLSFTISTESLREFIAFDGQTFFTPEIEGEVANQNLHARVAPDMVIVTHPVFESQANQIADLHRQNDNMDVLVVTNQQLYNEFSSGTPDVSALRNFMKMYYDQAQTDGDIPKYLLLFGDGSYDNKSSDASNTNFVLTYESANSTKPTSSYATDDYYAILDDNETISTGSLDLGIGRFPVKNVTEAQAIVDKMVHYEAASASYGDWRNWLCFIADDEDNNQHVRDADKFTVYIDTTYPVFNIDKIYLDAFVQESTPAGQRYPDVVNAIENRINKGALIINYTGHGGELGLAHESVITINQINSWDNYDKLPLFMTATCEFSRFDDPDRTSAGELIILNPKGGGVGLFTTTRVVYASANATLNNYFYRNIFKKDSTGIKYRLGDVMMHTKNSSGAGTNTRNFTLLCDPALELAFPEEDVITTKINDINISPVPDTLKALSHVTLNGYIADNTGNKLTDFNGIAYITIFDKRDSINTLGNDGNPPFAFTAQNSILYKGKASVTNGDFSCSFIVPKDISYRIGYGKFSYYAENTSASASFKDAGGYYNNIIIGGSSDSVMADDKGPEIEMFMNDEDFVFGGITDENPTFLAYLSDSSGINTVGNGIGHDMTLVLDGNTSKMVVLNDHYEADVDSYQKGKATYDFSQLSEGIHSLKLKAWDVYNNSSESYIEFMVAQSSELILDRIFNYPNPFTTKTAFFFEHNQPGMDLEVLIQIFTVSGKVIKTIQALVNEDNFNSGNVMNVLSNCESNPLCWDGFDDFGSPIGRGVYIYRIQVRSPNGNVVNKFEKLVILK